LIFGAIEFYTKEIQMAVDVVTNPAKSFEFVQFVRNEALHNTNYRSKAKFGITAYSPLNPTPADMANQASKQSLQTQRKMTPQDRLIDIVV
jgi:hypothetical protein